MNDQMLSKLFKQVPFDISQHAIENPLFLVVMNIECWTYYEHKAQS